MDFDIIVVGAGPAGLSAAIRCAQLAKENKKNITICILEKGAKVGAHIISGAVLEPHALDELIPDWKAEGAPLHTPVTHDQFLWLTKKRAIPLPVPPSMNNQGNTIISLGLLCEWLARYAENLGIQIFPGFAATEVLYQDDAVCGVATGDKGLDKEGRHTERYQAGIELYAKQTIFAEGCRGSLTQQLFQRFSLRRHCDPETYALGMKELWEVPEEFHREGLVVHTIGWPLNTNTYGGSFIYHLHKRWVALGLVIGLDYKNPYLNPYEEFQRFKTHPLIAPMLEKSKRLAYGARALNEGGIQAIPKLTFPGGLLVGCGAGFLNVPQMKGIHNAMKSGMLAADSVYPLVQHEGHQECVAYEARIKTSALWKELYRARNIRPAMKWGLWPGLLYSAMDAYMLRGCAPWTFHVRTEDAQSLQKANLSCSIAYPKHDHKISFDITSSLDLAHIHHPENQPCHLHLKNKDIPTQVNLRDYAAPETRYCPAGVYEILVDVCGNPALQINSANCVQCKACDIKDPMQNIIWVPPEGGSGPNYGVM